MLGPCAVLCCAVLGCAVGVSPSVYISSDKHVHFSRPHVTITLSVLMRLCVAANTFHPQALLVYTDSWTCYSMTCATSVCQQDIGGEQQVGGPIILHDLRDYAAGMTVPSCCQKAHQADQQVTAAEKLIQAKCFSYFMGMLHG